MCIKQANPIQAFTSRLEWIFCKMLAMRMYEMLKRMTVVIMVSALSACAFDPVAYEQLRQTENLQHNRTMG